MNLKSWRWIKTDVVSLLQNVPAALYTDPNEIAQHLNLKLTVCEKLELPVMEPQTTADEDRQWPVEKEVHIDVLRDEEQE